MQILGQPGKALLLGGKKPKTQVRCPFPQDD